ncbi:MULTISPECIES: RNA polymerase sigma factor [unclassified Sphingobacterium]|uniref:RNA polymerase sigma factor n=1 Tax=unclassified Sphingobacterium TaxID=2609468 RepID=UPI002596144D|nr:MULTISPECIES: sigma-70 family RNA polymerase sigma factor [unclassified Sphingobacterium]
MGLNVIDNEKQVIIDLKNGSYEAFNTIYYANRQALVYHAFRFLKSEDLVEEVIQELFSKLWEIKGKLQEDRSIKPLLTRILKNLIIDFFRKLKYDESAKEKFIIQLDQFYSPIELEIAAKEKKEILMNALSRLPALQREIFILFKLEQKSYKELEEMYGLTKAAIHSYIYRTNVFLKSYFRDFDKNDLILIFLCLDLIS